MRWFLATLALLLAGALLYFSLSHLSSRPVPTKPAPVVSSNQARQEVIGRSVQGRPINAYNYGSGEKKLLLVGGVHGGYEWNSVLLAYQAMAYLQANPDLISKHLTVTIIPNINPDAVYAVTGKEGRFLQSDVSTSTVALENARFNANQVDLNRNFDCKWQAESTWRTRKVSAGKAAFSEPETIALRDWVLKHKPVAAIFWHSQANAVYASECQNGILPDTLKLMDTYAKAASYPAVKSFDSYSVTGDAEGWLASINIPAITVELSTHDTVEWDKNLAGIKAVLASY